MKDHNEINKKLIDQILFYISLFSLSNGKDVRYPEPHSRLELWLAVGNILGIPEVLPVLSVYLSEDGGKLKTLILAADKESLQQTVNPNLPIAGSVGEPPTSGDLN